MVVVSVVVLVGGGQECAVGAVCAVGAAGTLLLLCVCAVVGDVLVRCTSCVFYVLVLWTLSYVYDALWRS